ncbi:membrane hypothetical protein [uncultured Eubacteriales bacterium]|uniref:Uncharacterized protein n=1 Tax=uncultured Eubacteriales bacterium TaxID=172733 RepID=A0A212JCS9_9FIRM|nr:membrane hypothetical protein [uncultured Eubacteriales bacterium]
MILGIAVFCFLCVVFRFPACRWLLIEEKELTPREERACVLFGNLNGGLAVLFALLRLTRGRWGDYAYLGVGVLSALLVGRFVYRALIGRND